MFRVRLPADGLPLAAIVSRTGLSIPLVLLSMSLCLVSLSCTTHSNRAVHAEPPASGESVNRQMASSDEDDSAEAYERLITSPQSEQEMNGYIEEWMNLFFKSHAAVAQFDAALDSSASDSSPANAVDPMLTMNYARLQAMYHILHRHRERIRSLYSRLLDDAAESNGARDSDRRQTAMQILKAFHVNLESRKGAEKIALANLARELDQIHRTRSSGSRSGTWTRLAESLGQAGLQKLMLKDSKSLDHAYRESRAELSKRADQASSQMDELSQEINEMAVSIRAGIAAMRESRSPQGETIFASNGRDGNLTGRPFPAGAWALTYDDGPSNQMTAPILELLQKNKTPATFFMLARKAHAYPKIVSQVKAAGMGLANHSYSHANLSTAKPAALNREIVQSTHELEGLYARKIRFFRCPYGAGVHLEPVRSRITNLGMIHVLWNVDSLDWQDHNPSSILARVKKQMAKEGRGVILFHDIHPQTVETTRLLLNDFESDRKLGKMRWVGLDEIVDEVNGRGSAR